MNKSTVKQSAVNRTAAPPVRNARADTVSAPERLAALIRIPTVSLPPEEDTQQRDMSSAVFDRFHAELHRLYPAVFKTCVRIPVGRYPLILHWRGNDSSQSIVLAAHQDVVPAAEDGAGWQNPPFSGSIDDSCVWGRGALDDKGSLCAIFEACETLISEGFVPAVDVYLCFSHNEETMGWGAAAIVAELQKRAVRPLFVLDEGGAVVERPLPLMKGKAAMIGISEKGVADIRFCAPGSGGHASTPPKQSPLGRLGAFAASVEKKPPFKTVVTPALAQMLKKLSVHIAFPLNCLFRFPYVFAPLLCFVFKRAGGTSRALVQTSCAFTMAQGSKAVNVLPEAAFFTANLRLLNCDSLDSVLKTLKQRARKYNIETELVNGHEASPDSVLHRGWEVLCKALEAEFAGVPAIPYIMLAASDARHYCKLCSAVYRFAPFEMSAELRKSVHGSNERIETANFERGIRFYRSVIRNI